MFTLNKTDLFNALGPLSFKFYFPNAPMLSSASAQVYSTLHTVYDTGYSVLSRS